MGVVGSLFRWLRPFIPLESDQLLWSKVVTKLNPFLPTCRSKASWYPIFYRWTHRREALPHLLSLFFFKEIFGDSSWEPRFVVAVLEDWWSYPSLAPWQGKRRGKSNLSWYRRQEHFKIPHSASPKAPMSLQLYRIRQEHGDPCLYPCFRYPSLNSLVRKSGFGPAGFVKFGGFLLKVFLKFDIPKLRDWLISVGYVYSSQ